MNEEDIIYQISKVLDIYEEIEFKRVNLFFNELSFEKIESFVDSRLKVIDVIYNVNIFCQKVKEILSKGNTVNMNQFINQLVYLKKELGKYLTEGLRINND